MICNTMNECTVSSTRHAIDPMAKLAASAVSMLLCTLSKSFLIDDPNRKQKNIKSKKLKVSSFRDASSTVNTSLLR